MLPANPETARLEEELVKYERWERQLQEQLANVSTERRGMHWFLLLAMITAPVGFFFRPLIALIILAVWLILWGTGMYLTLMHIWEYRGELERAHHEMSRLHRLLDEKADTFAGATQASQS